LARRFFDWAHRRGLTLETIDAPVVTAYARRLAAEKSPQTVASYLAPIRGVLHVLSDSGVIHQNPCPSKIPISSAPTAVAAGPRPPMPQTPEEWQAAIDAAEMALTLDSLMQYSLIESDGDFSVNADRCREILKFGRSLGYNPSRDDGTAAHGYGCRWFRVSTPR
jgi:hypothetical protein